MSSIIDVELPEIIINVLEAKRDHFRILYPLNLSCLILISTNEKTRIDAIFAHLSRSVPNVGDIACSAD